MDGGFLVLSESLLTDVGGWLAGRNVAVLSWHHVQPTWRYAGSPASMLRSFRSQLRALKRWTSIVPLDSALSRMRSGMRLPSRSVALTFDDGYRDNLEVAGPLLREMRVPATIFLCPEILSGNVDPWWERLGWALRMSRRRMFSFEGDELSVSSAKERAASWGKIEANFRRLTCAARDAAMIKLVAELDPVGQYSTESLFMNWDDARKLRQLGFSIGSHSMRHAILSRETANVQAYEILRSRIALESAFDQQIESFAYPSGTPIDYDHETVRVVSDAGYLNGLVAWGMISGPSTPPLEMARRLVSPNRGAGGMFASAVYNGLRERY